MDIKINKICICKTQNKSLNFFSKFNRQFLSFLNILCMHAFLFSVHFHLQMQKKKSPVPHKLYLQKVMVPPPSSPKPYSILRRTLFHFHFNLPTKKFDYFHFLLFYTQTFYCCYHFECGLDALLQNKRP